METRKDRTAGPLAADGISQEDYKNPLVADYLVGRLPKGLIKVNGHPQAAPDGSPRQIEVLTPEQMIDQMLADLRTAFLKRPETVAQCLEPVIELAFLQNEIDREAVREALPYNAAQVRAGGFAVLQAQSVDEAKAMKVDTPALGRSLAMAERVRGLEVVIGKANQILVANGTRHLARIAEHVTGGIKRGASVIQNNGALLRTLQPALAIRDEPIADGLQSRADNARRDEAVRTDEQSKLAAAMEPAATPATSVTVQTPTAPSTPRVPPPGKKPGA